MTIRHSGREHSEIILNIMTIGFFSLFMFHSTESMVAINLAIVAVGISLIQVGAFNITM
jgi:hypothetical protein